MTSCSASDRSDLHPGAPRRAGRRPAEDISTRDIFGKFRLTERAYSSAHIDVHVWAAEIESDFRTWREVIERP